RVNKAAAGHLAKAGVEAGTVLKEFPVDPAKASEFKPGDTIAVSLFEAGQKVDVQGVTIGKGYAGTIKRHNFSSQRASHGNSRSHNVPGSISMAQDPGRVFPGKKMTGHMGDETVTTQNLDIVRVDEARQLLLVKGAVPGAKNGHVVVRPAVKVRLKKGAQ
ncbi:MAG: 50S ribosomal protein L3, partial [Betaproteobacteria bacterium]